MLYASAPKNVGYYYETAPLIEKVTTKAKALFSRQNILS